MAPVRPTTENTPENRIRQEVEKELAQDMREYVALKRDMLLACATLGVAFDGKLLNDLRESPLAKIKIKTGPDSHLQLDERLLSEENQLKTRLSKLPPEEQEKIKKLLETAPAVEEVLRQKVAAAVMSRAEDTKSYPDFAPKLPLSKFSAFESEEQIRERYHYVPRTKAQEEDRLQRLEEELKPLYQRQKRDQNVDIQQKSHALTSNMLALLRTQAQDAALNEFNHKPEIAKLREVLQPQLEVLSRTAKPKVGIIQAEREPPLANAKPDMKEEEKAQEKQMQAAAAQWKQFVAEGVEQEQKAKAFIASIDKIAKEKSIMLTDMERAFFRDQIERQLGLRQPLADPGKRREKTWAERIQEQQREASTPGHLGVSAPPAPAPGTAVAAALDQFHNSNHTVELARDTLSSQVDTSPGKGLAV